jgi:MoaA/NifB/PqqE/SkfB family radical SAM enzyme
MLRRSALVISIASSSSAGSRARSGTTIPSWRWRAFSAKHSGSVGFGRRWRTHCNFAFWGSILNSIIDGQDSLAGESVHPIENDGQGTFCWTRPRFKLRRPVGRRYLALHLGRARVAHLNILGSTIGRHIEAGWYWYSIDLGAEFQSEHELAIDRFDAGPADTRELGAMLRAVVWHDSAERHAQIERVRTNTVLNEAEYQSGAVVLKSVPPLLRLSMEVRCNIASNQACVYCSWKGVKRDEIGSPDFNMSFLRTLDPYWSAAREINDCSFGEPPMHAQFAEIVDLIASEERAFSFTTNGKMMGPKTRKALLGRNVLVYVSIDSPTSAGFARYRDLSFDRIIRDLRALCAEKKQHRNLPYVTASFIVMNSNRDEIRDYLALMQSVGVDQVKLRHLDYENSMEFDGPVQQRGDFVFDYAREVVAPNELAASAREARQAAAELGLKLYIDWQDFEAASAPGLPLCAEPWQTLYAFQRGFFPCSFGRKPIASWSEQGNRSAEEFFEAVRNGPELREMRSALARGVFPNYCKTALCCPIVNRATADGTSNVHAK